MTTDPSIARNKSSPASGRTVINQIPVMPLIKKLKAAIHWLSSPALIFYTMPLLIALLIAGTIAQRYIGLYDAQKMFFSSFIFWAGPLPLPGGYSLMGLITLGLLTKFLFKSRWVMAKAGINIAHLGVLVLLIGGMMTAIFSEEGYIVIPEGDQSAYVSDFHQRTLLVIRDGHVIAEIPHQTIFQSERINSPAFPFTIKVLDHCRNCEIIRREDATTDYNKTLTGMAQFMALTPKPPEHEEEVNLNGATLAINDTAFIVFEAMPKPFELAYNENEYQIIFGKKQRMLPFSIKLEDFQKTKHPGTMTASAYHSDVVVIDGNKNWPVRIEMNKPLRYKGYTFFQSSFADNEIGEATILSVVKNKGWLFPYIGTGIIAFGLLLHVLVRVSRRNAS
jgi:hypothetical protein